MPTQLRLQRLREREARRFGADAIAVGGWRHREAQEFFEWAARYDDDTRVGRNLKRHEVWLAGLPCPVVRIDGTRSTRELVAQVCVAVGHTS